MLFLMILFIPIIMLQVFLSKKQNKWLGRILPIICFVSSLFIVLGIVSYTSITTETTTLITEGSELINEVTSTADTASSPNTYSMLLEAVTVFVVSNIPTVLLLLIYLNCQKNLPKNLELNRMAIQDL